MGHPHGADQLGDCSDYDVTPRAWQGAKAEQVCTSLRAALAAQPAEPVARDAALNTLAQVFHNGEEAEGDDGAVMMVDLALWNEGCEALESLVSEDELAAPPHPPSLRIPIPPNSRELAPPQPPNRSR